MWHNVKKVARNHGFDEHAFNEFSQASFLSEEFGLIKEAGVYHVSTWHCDNLVNAFRLQELERGAQEAGANQTTFNS